MRATDHQFRTENLEPAQMDVLNALQDFQGNYGGTLDDDDTINLNDVLDGTTRGDISQGGGEFEEAIWQDMDSERQNARPKCPDWKTRRDRVQKRTNAFAGQMEDMVAMYIVWMGAGSPAPRRLVGEGTGEERGYPIRVVDLFDTYTLDAFLDAGGRGVAAALIKQGLFPCAPFDPTVVISTRTLEFFRVVHIRCPHLAIQAFVKTLCDLHGEPYKPCLCQQFTICYDLYLDVKRNTERKVLALLGRDESWRLKHACPACMYELEGEPEMVFSILATIDGNKSLRRVWRKEANRDGEVDEETGDPIAPKSRERTDTRDAGDGYYIHRDKVDEWVKKRLANALPTDKIPGEEIPVPTDGKT
ncbi:hypothetical protein B0H17DRAFT_1214845 [Mycena rosella]|uniref:CxC1-like cysteine cluster associated with KDZ transposases domain-containing protein n=1 Tax=Mycena rosella TaxID=1033263 RepID=A0AAD7CM55_MYCRO|nr:hypothetical protein B0H17DRAFT_1214845 [Mycena rosella]